jgi:hypothetical protein
VRHSEVRPRRPSTSPKGGSRIVARVETVAKGASVDAVVTDWASMGCRRPERSLCYGKISRYKDSNHKNQPLSPNLRRKISILVSAFRSLSKITVVMSSSPKVGRRLALRADYGSDGNSGAVTLLRKPRLRPAESLLALSSETAKKFAVARRCNTFCNTTNLNY